MNYIVILHRWKYYYFKQITYRYNTYIIQLVNMNAYKSLQPLLFSVIFTHNYPNSRPCTVSWPLRGTLTGPRCMITGK